jgi:hypothetical protein
VNVTLPEPISDRVRVMTGYLEPGAWPPQCDPRAIETMQSLVSFIPMYGQEIVKAIRTTAAATIRDDGSRAVAVRDRVLLAYLRAMATALARTLLTYTLVGESPLPWLSSFVGCGNVYSPNVIYGLAYHAARETTFAGWTDADLFLNDRRLRFFAPICPSPGEADVEGTYGSGTIEKLIVPQLLETSYEPGETHLHVRRLLLEPWTAVNARIIRRDEFYIDSVACKDRSEARACILEVAADRLVRALAALPLHERLDAMAKSIASAGPLQLPLFDAVSRSFPEWASRP